MPAHNKKVEVEIEVTETPVEETVITPEPVIENEKPILVAETEPEETPPESTDSSRIFGPVATELPTTNKGLFWILIVVFALLGAVAGGVGIYLQNRTKITAVLPSPSSEIIIEASPSLAPQLDKKLIQIQVLNGSGVTGAAKAAQDYLEGLGYRVIAVGNASSADFPTTTIAIKDTKKEYFPSVKQDLSNKYTVGDQADSLTIDSKYDIVITLGKE